MHCMESAKEMNIKQKKKKEMMKTMVTIELY